MTLLHTEITKNELRVKVGLDEKTGNLLAIIPVATESQAALIEAAIRKTWAAAAEASHVKLTLAVRQSLIELKEHHV